MRQTFGIKFYCKSSKRRKTGEAPVEVSLIVNGERLQWQTPMRCKPESFKKDKDVKAYCSAIESRIRAVYSTLSIQQETISVHKIKDMLDTGSVKPVYTLENLFADGLKVKAAENRDLGTYRKYELVVQRFYPRTGLSPQTEADKVTVSDILTFRAKAMAEHDEVTVAKEMRNLKYFFKLAFDSGKTKSNPGATVKVKSIARDMEYLEYDEVKKVRQLRLTNDRLDRVRDVFLFLCFTGLEWADIIALKPEDVKCNSKHQYYIRKPRAKTGIEYISILYEDAIDIWHMYEGKLPLVSPQKFNIYIKEVMEMAGIDKTISSLTGRHTYACYLLNTLGLSEEIVSKMMGHTSTKQTRHYAKMFAETVFNANRQVRAPRSGEPRMTLDLYREEKDTEEWLKKTFGI